MMIYALRAASLAAIVAAGVQSANAQAPTDTVLAERERASSGFGEDIVVNARRREESIGRVPIAVTAFTGDTLNDKQIVNVRDLTKLTPGLNFGGLGALTSSTVVIRGFSRASAGPGSPGVIVYFNDVPQSNFAANIPTYDMETIQVLKGPQGTLFGRNAIGGAILAYSKRPTHDFGGYVQAQYDTFNTQHLEGAINLPIIANKVALRVAGQMISSDGFVKGFLYSPTNARGIGPGVALNTRPVHLDQSDVRAVRASLLIEPSEDMSNVTTVDYTRYSGIGGIVLTRLVPGALSTLPPATLTALGLGPLLNPNWHCGVSANCDVDLALAASLSHPRTQLTDVRPYSLTQSFGVINTTTFDIAPNLTIKNIFGYRTIKQDQTTDLDGTAINLVASASLVDQKQITDELQLSGNLLDDKLNFAVGGFYYKTSPNGLGGDQALHVLVFGGVSNQFTLNYLVSKSKAVYGQVDYDASQFIRGLKLTAGYRYTWDDQYGCAYGTTYGPLALLAGVLPSAMPTFRQCQSTTFRDPTAITTSVSNQTASSSAGTYTLAANWQATDELFLYATARSGYRSGGFNIPTLDPRLANVQQFGPEKLYDIELGAKGRIDIGGLRGTFAFAAYRGKVKGSQAQITTAGVISAIPLPPVGPVLNKNDYTIRGVEGQVQIEPFDGFTIGGNAAYYKAKLDKFNIPPNIQEIYDTANASNLLEGFAIGNQTKWQVNANTQYTARNAIGSADAFIGADFHYQDAYFQGGTPIPGHKVVDARLGVKGLHDGSVDAILWMKNLFDKRYYYGSSLNGTVLGFITYLQAPPRTIGISLAYRFDR